MKFKIIPLFIVLLFIFISSSFKAHTVNFNKKNNDKSHLFIPPLKQINNKEKVVKVEHSDLLKKQINDLDISGIWNGILKQNNSSEEFDMHLKLKQTKKQLKGTIEFIDKRGSGLKVIYKISGRIDSENKILLFEESIVEEYNNNQWCKKKYIGNITLTSNNSLKIEGIWENDDNYIFSNKQIINGGGCTPGTFLVFLQKDIINDNNTNVNEGLKKNQKYDIDISGNWDGTLNQNNSYQEFNMHLKLKQKNRQISGTIEFINKTSLGMRVVFGISGQIDAENKILLSDDSVIEESNWHQWCKKKYMGNITITTNNQLKIEGSWENDENKSFINQQISDGGGCTPGTFSVILHNDSKNVSNENKQLYDDLTAQLINKNYSGINVSGKWKGTCEEGFSSEYKFLLNLSQTYNIIKGTAELNKDYNSTKYKVSGTVENNTILIIIDEVTELIGTSYKYEYNFRGTISSENNTLVIKGEAINTSSEKYEGGKWVTLNNSFNKKFIVAKVNEEEDAKKCISGNCINGFGVKVTDEGKYSGEFKDGKKEGKGIFDFYKRPNAGYRYVGEFKGDVINGYGILYTSNKQDIKSYEGNWVYNYPNGLGKMYHNRLGRIGYYVGWYLDENRGVTFDLLKSHLDTTFKKFQPCNCCLTPKQIYISASGIGLTPYDVVDTYTGKKVSSGSDLSLVDRSFTVKGYVNSSNKNIYIKCYRKVYSEERKVFEYFDESYVLEPGGEIIESYRQLPGAMVIYDRYIKTNFIVAGRYCLKK